MLTANNQSRAGLYYQGNKSECANDSSFSFLMTPAYLDLLTTTPSCMLLLRSEYKGQTDANTRLSFLSLALQT